jgi:hypothetical protein
VSQLWTFISACPLTLILGEEETMLKINSIAVAVLLLLSSCECFAQSSNAEEVRLSQIKFLNDHQGEQIRITFKNNYVITGRFDRTFYHCFEVFEQQGTLEIYFSDVAKLELLKTPRHRIWQIVKFPVYGLGAIVSAPGAALFYLSCKLSPDPCQ